MPLTARAAVAAQRDPHPVSVGQFAAPEQTPLNRPIDERIAESIRKLMDRPQSAERCLGPLVGLLFVGCW